MATADYDYPIVSASKISQEFEDSGILYSHCL